tara:strand:- start:644 stop:1117 length:474 start_codon:yes stop_codon:yes gene_type:complete
MIDNTYYKKKNSSLQLLSLAITFSFFAIAGYDFVTHLKKSNTPLSIATLEANTKTKATQTQKPTLAKTHHSQTQKNITYFFKDISPINNKLQSLQLKNGYSIQFTKWAIYVLKNNKNIKGNGIAFLRPKKALTIHTLKQALNNQSLWPSKYSLKEAS